MARRVYARRYAQAVFNIALETKELDSWQSDLSKIAALAEDSSLVTVLQSPKLPLDIKIKLLSERLEGINPLALNLVYLLVTRGRLGMIKDIADEYQRLLDSQQGIERAEVTTAIPLDDEGKRRLGERLGAIIGKKVTITAEVDPGVVTGVVARIGGKLFEGSTRGKLAALKKELVRGSR